MQSACDAFALAQHRSSRRLAVRPQRPIAAARTYKPTASADHSAPCVGTPAALLEGVSAPKRSSPRAMRSSVTAGRSRAWGRACRTAGRATKDGRGAGDGGGDPEEGDGSSSSGTVAKLAITAVPLLVIVGLVTAAGGPQGALDALSGAVATAGPLAPLYYGLAYITACITLLPASVLTLGAGALFGTVKGTAVVAVSATAGATASFVIARYIARPYVEKFLAGQRTFRAVDSAIGRDGAKVVFLLRLSPLFPFSIGNYALGLSSVRLFEYVGATLVGILPGTFAYVNIGAVGRAATEAATGGGEGGDIGTMKLVLYGVGAAATLLVTRAVSKAANAALEEEKRNDAGAGAQAEEDGNR